jgi:hypothetical protein
LEEGLEEEGLEEGFDEEEGLEEFEEDEDSEIEVNEKALKRGKNRNFRTKSINFTYIK